jgi:hypothetical protein
MRSRTICYYSSPTFRVQHHRFGGMSNPNIDAWYDVAMNNGAIGGKLIGAGGGGFLMFVPEDRIRLRHATREAGLPEVRRAVVMPYPPMPPVALRAGGLATRLYPLAEKMPKALIQVAGEPFIAHQLRLLHREGIPFAAWYGKTRYVRLTRIAAARPTGLMSFAAIKTALV